MSEENWAFPLLGAPNILGMLAGRYTVQRILQAYPELTREDIAAALEYAGQVIDEERVIPRV